MTNFLIQLDIDFISEYSPDWIDLKRYDFYIPSHSMIIETDGLQHKKDVGGYFNYDEIKNNDKLKKELAKLNGIKYYINMNSFSKYK